MLEVLVRNFGQSHRYCFNNTCGCLQGRGPAALFSLYRDDFAMFVFNQFLIYATDSRVSNFENKAITMATIRY